MKKFKKQVLIIGVMCVLSMMPTVTHAESLPLSAMSFESLVNKRIFFTMGKNSHRLYRDEWQRYPRNEMMFNPSWKTLVTIGDSITYGRYTDEYNGTFYDNNCFPYGYYASKIAHFNYKSVSIPGAKIVRGKKEVSWIFYQVRKHQDIIKQASVITIKIGVNDFLKMDNLNQIASQLSVLIDEIRAINPNAQLLGILPLVPYVSNRCVIEPNDAGYSFLQFYLAEEKVYRSKNIPVVSFYQLGFSDGGTYSVDRLHPTPLQQREMGEYLGYFLKNQRW